MCEEIYVSRLVELAVLGPGTKSMGSDGDMGRGIKRAKRDMTTLTLFIEGGIRAKQNHNTR